MLPFNERWIGRETINNTMVVEFLKKNKNVFFKIIFNRLKFEEDKNVNIDMVGYVKFDEKKSIYLFRYKWITFLEYKTSWNHNYR